MVLSLGLPVPGLVPVPLPGLVAMPGKKPATETEGRRDGEDEDEG